MKIKIIAVMMMCLMINACFAGYGRGSSSGGFRSSSFSSSRSYSAPRWTSSSRSYSAPRRYSAPSRTVVREYHTQTNTGGGIHPMVAGMAGYMIGDAMNRHGQASAPVYVNGQAIPQPAQPKPAAQQNYDQQYPQQVTQSQPEESHSGLFYFFLILFLLFFAAVAYQLGKKNS